MGNLLKKIGRSALTDFELELDRNIKVWKGEENFLLHP